MAVASIVAGIIGGVAQGAFGIADKVKGRKDAEAQKKAIAASMEQIQELYDQNKIDESEALKRIQTTIDATGGEIKTAMQSRFDAGLEDINFQIESAREQLGKQFTGASKRTQKAMAQRRLGGSGASVAAQTQLANELAGATKDMEKGAAHQKSQLSKISAADIGQALAGLKMQGLSMSEGTRMNFMNRGDELMANKIKLGTGMGSVTNQSNGNAQIGAGLSGIANSIGSYKAPSSSKLGTPPTTPTKK